MEKIIIYFTTFFIIYEIIKLVFLKTFWRLSNSKNKNIPILMTEGIYLTFIIILFFSKYWFFAALIFIMSIITSIVNINSAKSGVLDKKYIKCLLIDNILSVIILVTILMNEIL